LIGRFLGVLFFRRWLAPALTIALVMPTMPNAYAAPTASNGKACTIVGTQGNDVINGTSKNDVICGLGGRDVIRGLGGNDTIDGGAGGDLIVGGAGNDQILGGLGSDVLSGDGGSDQLRGGLGNDDLTGGAGEDIVDGGEGTDWCTVDGIDLLTRCVYDRSAPLAFDLKVGPSATVDVTDRAALVNFTVEVSDDTGVRQLQVMAQDSETGHSLNVGTASLISGTVREGTWRAFVQIPRYAPPGRFTIEAFATDRVGRTATASFPVPLRVRNLNPDLERPEVELLSPSPSTVIDVRTSSKVLLIRARIKDSLSGVAEGGYFCAEYPMDDFYTHDGCVSSTLASGTTRDGIWEARVPIPSRSIGGDWNVSVWASDRARPADITATVGPDIMRAWTLEGAETTAKLFPNGKGRFTVRGAVDSNAPSLVEVQLTPSSVDTLERAAAITINARAVDIEGVTSVGVSLHPIEMDSGSVSFAPADLALTSGTNTDGWWSGTIVLPRGTPPGRYVIQIWVRDATHWRSYVSRSSPYFGTPAQGSIPGSPDPGITVIER
jgi:hypothetical protein